MTQTKPQTFRNHASFDPWFHVVSAACLLFSLVASVVYLVLHIHDHPLLSIWLVVLSFVLIVMLIKLRSYPMKVQDRVIRLEERIRLVALLPPALNRRIPELTEDQLIALRFASDEEIPALVELTLDKHLTRRQIKERIQNWRPDYWRV